MRVDRDFPRVVPRLGAACLLAAVLTSGLPVAADAAKQEPVGFVLEMAGKWQIDGKPPIAVEAGGELPASAKLVVVQPTDKSFLTVCFFTGDAKTYRNLKQNQVTLPAAAKPAFTERLRAAITGQYRGGVVHAISRGDGLSDGVARLDTGKLDLDSLLDSLPQGKHLLKFSVAKEKSATPAVILPLDWNPDEPAPLAAETLAAGLYRVELLDKRSKRPTGAEAILLVASAGDYASLHKQFEAAKALTAQWDEETRARSAAPFLRAVLTALATEQTTAK